MRRGREPAATRSLHVSDRGHGHVVPGFQHARFRRGETLELRGVSHLKFRDDGKVFQHHDYFDMGEFIYERVAVLGGVIRAIKSRL